MYLTENNNTFNYCGGSGMKNQLGYDKLKLYYANDTFDGFSNQPD